MKYWKKNWKVTWLEVKSVTHAVFGLIASYEGFKQSSRQWWVAKYWNLNGWTDEQANERRKRRRDGYLNKIDPFNKGTQEDLINLLVVIFFHASIGDDTLIPISRASVWTIDRKRGIPFSEFQHKSLTSDSV